MVPLAPMVQERRQNQSPVNDPQHRQSKYRQRESKNDKLGHCCFTFSLHRRSLGSFYLNFIILNSICLTFIHIFGIHLIIQSRPSSPMENAMS